MRTPLIVGKAQVAPHGAKLWARQGQKLGQILSDAARGEKRESNRGDDDGDS